MTMPDAMMSLYGDASLVARRNEQTIGVKRDYYITLEQLMDLMKPYVDTGTSTTTSSDSAG